MFEEHLDPTVEAHAQVTNLLRTLITAAAGMAEKRAQRRAQELQEAQRRSEEHRRALNERLAAQRRAAEAVYRRAYQDSWWQTATPEQIAGAVAAAGTWAASDARANDALAHLAERLQDRYHIDLVDLYRHAENPATVSAAVRDRLNDTQHTATEPAAWDARAAVLAGAGPALANQILASEGWHHLQRRLDTMHDAGDDVDGRFRRAVNERELDTAKDKALALTWRLRTVSTADTAGRNTARAAQQAAHGSRPPGQPSKASDATRTARRFADNQRLSENQRDNGPEASAS